MPPKSKTLAADKSKDVQETEDILQAVVLTDSFEARFAPFTSERPRCLLPLANTPLIEYTLEFLASSGVKEVFLYCGAHNDLIEEYISASRWTSSSSPFRVEIIRSTSRSIGDAMRDLEKRSILAGDFIVIYGDVITNTNLDHALAAHRARRAADKNAIMTMILRETDTYHRNQPNDMLPIFVMDPEKERCLHYEQITTRGPGERPQIDQELLNRDIDVRVDLLDCGIDICTPDVLALWADNFDYEAPRKGFLYGVLKDYELNGKTFHTHILEEGYAARVRSLQAYAAISQDVLARWTFPLSPDVNWNGRSQYIHNKQSTFTDANARIARSSRTGPNVAIGTNSTVSSKSIIATSVIGADCTIGGSCRIKGSYIWDNVSIGDSTTVQNAVIAWEARIGKNCTILPGALISYRVNVPDGTVVKKGQQLIQDTGASTYRELAPSDEVQSIVGTAKSLRLSTSSDSISTLASEDSDFDSPVQRSGSVVSATSDDSHGTPSAEAFVGEAATSIYDALIQSQDVSTIQLELQGLRMAANASEHHVRRAVVSGLVRYLLEAQRAGKQIKDILAANQTLIERTVFDKGTEKKADQVDFLLLAQAELAKKPVAQGEASFKAVCNGLYLIGEDGLFETEAYQQWWDDERSQALEPLVRLRKNMEQWMEVIVAEPGSDSEDEADGSSEEEASDEA